mmetsp:Transcript_13093/g.15819  ORF Transcript_13093/g.15819 Transcript_13093/m.15819 type:complete len:218 (-) Transcript_13093:95-748(-)
MPRGPCSRHIACALPGKKSIVVHSFRCLESILLYEDKTMREQPTKGPAPSSRGLHSAAMVGDELVVFGGADKSGNMCADVYALHTKSWTWRKVISQVEDGPTPRAGSCAAALSDDRTFIMSCGAQRESDGSLKPRADLWALDLSSATWTKLLDDHHDAEGTFSVAPRPRNAAVLLPLSSLSTTSSIPSPIVDRFLLHGGWHPFQITFDDTFILEIRR